MSEIMAIGDRADNATLMADCAALGYLPEPVLDATYGKGRFWTKFRPSDLVTNDFDRESDADFHWDFCDLPFEDRRFKTVVFDGPYKLNGTSTGVGASVLDADYGVGGDYSPVAAKMRLLVDGATECARLADRFLLVKCQDQVVSGAVVWQTHILAAHVEGLDDDDLEPLGFRLVDMLHVQGYRKQPEGRRQLHARRDYSTLLVLERRTR